ncbi:MAG TPA: hypothetical protein VHC49_21410 [Mycobacteriales bacterium]|nr:hypothetical protein [Mycobacteriales bacterium]
MTDLERALRDTLADPPVDVPSDKYAIHDIQRRIERRRSRQKHLAAGLGVAAVVAAAIAVPVATGVDFGSGSSHSAGSAANGADRAVDHAPGAVVPAPENVPEPVWRAAQALVRDYGRPSGPAQWVRTTPQKWGQLRQIRNLDAATGSLYVLQFPDFRCTGPRCRAADRTGSAQALVATVSRDGKRLDVTFVPAYQLTTLGAVHTFSVR